MQQSILRLASLSFLLLGACAGGVPEGAAPAGSRLGDPVLYDILATVPLSPAADSALHEYELDHRRTFLERVSLVAEDPRAGTNARFNAVRILGERHASAYLPSLRIAATDRDPRVRAAVVVAAASIAERTGEGLTLVESLLDDPALEVAAKALERIDPTNLRVLRRFVRQHPAGGELVRMAGDMIRVAEERGAPLEADSAGVLRRRAAGVTLEFQPARRWPQWDAATGTVTLVPESSEPVRLENIEVVRSVVPVFVAPEGGQVAYEQGRRIYLRDFASGAVRDLGPGIAPRPLPFTSDFIFLREVPGSRGELADRTRLKYEVVRVPFADGGAEPRVIGTTTASAQHTASGGYAPVRWMRVAERNAVFSLEAEGMDPFHLPSAFSPTVPR